MIDDARPDISVLIQTYQHAPFIREAIESVLSQRGSFELEILIADDCSTDGTREIVREYGARHPGKVRLLLPEQNMGSIGLFRRAAGELRGRYVAWLDGDDLWLDQNKLALQMEALDAHPSWAGCFHDATVRYVDGDAPERPYVSRTATNAVSLRDLLSRDEVPALSVMARGDLVRELPEWVWGSLWSDWLALASIARHGEIGYLPLTMGAYRVHSGGLYAGLSRIEQLEEELRTLEILREELPEHEALIGSSLRERRCQLVVERSEVPFSGAVSVLGRPEETPSYLNGRTVLILGFGRDARGGLELDDADARLAARLERHRRHAAQAAPTRPHFRTPADRSLAGPEGELHLLVVGSAANWLDRYSRLGRQLAGSAELVHRDDDCALYLIRAPVGSPAPMGALIETVEVTPLPKTGALFACHLDEPIADRVVDAHAVDFAGWAIGEESPVVNVELAVDDKPFRRIPLGVARPDLQTAFPGRAGAADAGFRATISMVGFEPETVVEVRAVLKDRRRVPFATVTARRRWREDLDETDAPLVSVVIPCYRQAHYLRESIESVLAQTYAQLEVLVVDDESPDNAEMIARSYPGVRYVRQANSGPSSARNTGIRQSEGELIVFLDADDRLLPRALEHGVRTLRAYPQAAFTFGRYWRMTAGGERIDREDRRDRAARVHEDKRVRARRRIDRAPLGPSLDAAGSVEPVHGSAEGDDRGSLYSLFLRYNCAGIPATGMFRRSALTQVGGFDEAISGVEDYELGLRLSRQFSVQPHGEYVAEYRVHADGASRDAAMMLRRALQVLADQREHIAGDPELRAAHAEGRRFWREYYGGRLAEQARSSFANGEWIDGLRAARSLARYAPRGLVRAIASRASARD